MIRRAAPWSTNPDQTVSRSLDAFTLWALSILVGVAAGLGAVVFRLLIGFFHNLLFLGKISAVYDANTHTPRSLWGPFVILVPVVGAAGVTFLVKNFAPEAKGHGVPEVMDAVYHHKGIIRPVVSVVKALASALSIGSGGSIGREGPIVQIGSSFGSTMGQLLKLSPWQRITLIAAGAGGGIAATFNTPVGGVLFAAEIILHEVSTRTLVPVITATVTATYIGQMFFGSHPSFFIPALETPFFVMAKPSALLAYSGLGAIAGLVSALFIWSIYGSVRIFETHVKGGYYVQHMTAMLMVGILMYAFMFRFGHYYVEGVGYATIQDVLSGLRYPVYFLVLLFAAKLLATSLTLGSGASGGVFSPALFLGATAGGAYGFALNHFFPQLNLSPEAFAVVGMGSVVGGATGAAMAAIVMIFEMTFDYTVIVPMTLAVGISYGLRRALVKDSIYTRKLSLRGAPVPDALHADMQFSRRAENIMNRQFRVIPKTAPLPAFRDVPSARAPVFIVTDDSGKIVGVITDGLMSSDALTKGVTSGDVACKNYVTVTKDTSLQDVMAKMKGSNASAVLVTSKDGQFAASDVLGVITRSDIVEMFAADMELFND